MTLIIFILILSILIFVHELGHFVAAKKAGIYVEEFGFGLPPRIFGKKVGETIYSLNALPIGGFVKLYGEDGSEDEKKEVRGRAFYEKPIWRRLTVMLAGVFMNLLLAIFAFSLLYNINGIPEKTDYIRIVGLTDSSPAKEAGLREGDKILALNKEPVKDLKIFVAKTKEKAGQPMELEIERGEGAGTMIVKVVPRSDPPANEGPLGIAISQSELRKYPWPKMFFLGIREGFKESLAWSETILTSLKGIVVTVVSEGKIPKDLAGPIGIFQVTGEAAKSGFMSVLQLLGILSVNLAIFNILPLPALDGGRLIFLGYEVITRKRPSPKVESTVNTVGFFVLISLMILISINDILRLLHH